MQTHNLSANAPKIAKVTLSPHASAIHHNSRFGEIVAFGWGFPMTLDASFFESEANPYGQKTGTR
jgi:hypothetical protein